MNRIKITVINEPKTMARLSIDSHQSQISLFTISIPRDNHSHYCIAIPFDDIFDISRKLDIVANIDLGNFANQNMARY